MNIFERAARGKYRFATNRGPITVEDLFDMPLTSKNGFNLDAVAVMLDDQLEHSPRKSFVAPVEADDQRGELEAKLEIVKLVIADKLARLQAVEKRQAKAAERQRLLEVLARKEDEELTSASKEDIMAKLAALDD